MNACDVSSGPLVDYTQELCERVALLELFVSLLSDIPDAGDKLHTDNLYGLRLVVRDISQLALAINNRIYPEE